MADGEAFVPGDPQVIRFLAENAAVGKTERFAYLDRREAHYKGLQYEHQKLDWWGRDAERTETISPKAIEPAGFEWANPQEAPVRAKRPTAPMNLGKTIVERFTGMLLSEGRKPTIVCHDDPDTEDWLREVTKRSKFWSQMRALRNMGGSMGAALATAHVRAGRFSYEVHNPKNLTVVWEDKRTWTPRGVLVMWTEPVEVDELDDKGRRTGGTRVLECLHRRIITHMDEVNYRPLILYPDTRITWEVDPQLSVRHDLGFFPGVWVQNTSNGEEMDGDADCEGAWQMLDTLDRMVAQMNHGTLMNLDPTLWMNYDPKEVNNAGGVRKGSENALHLGTKGAAGYLEMTGAGIEIGLKMANLLKGAILDLTRCVLVDPEKISGSAQSAKAIEFIFEPMIERAGDFREQYGEAILGLLRVVERIGRKYEGQGVELGVNPVTNERETGALSFDLPARTVQLDDGTTRREERRLGPGGTIDIEWGPYFAPTEMDDETRIRNAVGAKVGGVIGGEAATKHVGAIFGVNDPHAEYQRASQEADAQAEKALAGLDGGVGLHPLTPQGAGGGGEGKPPRAGFGGKA